MKNQVALVGAHSTPEVSGSSNLLAKIVCLFKVAAKMPQAVVACPSAPRQDCNQQVGASKRSAQSANLTPQKVWPYTQQRTDRMLKTSQPIARNQACQSGRRWMEKERKAGRKSTEVGTAPTTAVGKLSKIQAQKPPLRENPDILT